MKAGMPDLGGRLAAILDALHDNARVLVLHLERGPVDPCRVREDAEGLCVTAAMARALAAELQGNANEKESRDVASEVHERA
jgi:hypothetical protein